MKRSFDTYQQESTETAFYLDIPVEIFDLINFHSIHDAFYAQLQQTNKHWHKAIPDLFYQNLPRLKRLFSHHNHQWLDSAKIFLYAAQNGLVSICRFLFTEHYITKNDKQLAFINAAQANQFEIAKLLLVDPDISPANKASAMWWSIENNWMPLFDLLAVEEEVWQAIHIYPALYLAQDKGHSDIAHKLSAKFNLPTHPVQKANSQDECRLM